jgi:hypothetical protein
MNGLPRYVWVSPTQSISRLLLDFSMRFPTHADELRLLVAGDNELRRTIEAVQTYVTNGIVMVRGMRHTPVILHALSQAIQAYRTAAEKSRNEQACLAAFKAALVVAAGALLHGVGLRDPATGELWTIRTGPLASWGAGRGTLKVELQDPGYDDEEAALLCLAEYVSGRPLSSGSNDLGLQAQTRVIH